jgi:hypothetical protein
MKMKYEFDIEHVQNIITNARKARMNEETIEILIFEFLEEHLSKCRENELANELAKEIVKLNLRSKKIESKNIQLNNEIEALKQFKPKRHCRVCARLEAIEEIEKRHPEWKYHNMNDALCDEFVPILERELKEMGF